MIESALLVLYGLKWISIAAKVCIALTGVFLVIFLWYWWGR